MSDGLGTCIARFANASAQFGNWGAREAIIGNPEEPQRALRLAPARDGRLDAIVGPRQRFCETGFYQPAAQPDGDA